MFSNLKKDEDLIKVILTNEVTHFGPYRFSSIRSLTGPIAVEAGVLKKYGDMYLTKIVGLYLAPML